MKEEASQMVRTEQQIEWALSWVEDMLRKTVKAGPVLIGLGRTRRSLDQNAKLWPMLQDVAKQCQLVINGVQTKATKEEWKTMFTAMLSGEQRVACGLNGGVVFLGRSTSRMNKAQFSELIELIYAYGAEHGVQWSEKAASDYEQYRGAR